jgi:cyclopropane fatty-acyl-phospholipid synthase-like methyltransferase
MKDPNHMRLSLAQAQAKLSTLPFPLNVYAVLQLWDLGRVEHLHYGLFMHPEEPLADAQRHSTELLFTRLPAPPARLLEVGVGLGTTQRKTAAFGYECCGITPDPAQIEWARREYPELDWRCVRFEDFQDDRAFDVVVFQESGQYMALGDLFGQARSVLDRRGLVILLDEFSTSGQQLHNVRHTLDAAADAGFTLLENSDWSAFAAPTQRYLLDQTERQRARLLAELPVDAGMIDGLNTSNRHYLASYASGRFEYRLMQFQGPS